MNQERLRDAIDDALPTFLTEVQADQVVAAVLALLCEYPEEVIELLGGEQVGWYCDTKHIDAAVRRLSFKQKCDDPRPAFAFPPPVSSSSGSNEGPVGDG